MNAAFLGREEGGGAVFIMHQDYLLYSKYLVAAADKKIVF
jgi:DNA phosphorothioation-dependent restriction protein DptG